MKRYQSFSKIEEQQMCRIENAMLDSFFQEMRQDKYFVKETGFFFKRYILFVKQFDGAFMVFNFSKKYREKVTGKVPFGILFAFFLGYDKAKNEII